MSDLEKRTLPALFQHTTSTYPDSVALSFVDENPYTFQQIRDVVEPLQKALRERGIGHGTKVAILSENSPRWGIAYMAVGTMGAVNVPILPDFHKSEVHHILRNSGCSVLFVSSKLYHKILDAQFKELKHIIVLDDITEGINGASAESFSDLVDNAPPKSKSKPDRVDEEREVEPDDLLEILYTSGTTGHSKGVMLTHSNIISNALSALKMISITNEDKLLSILPMSHSYECTCGFIAAFLGGAQIYYIKGLPTAQTLLPAVARIKPTIILSVPLIMDKIYKKKVLSEVNSKAVSKMMYKFPATRKIVHKVAGKKLYQAFGGNLRIMVFGGAATPIEVEQFLTDGGFPYITGYGLTESAPILTVNPVGKVKHGSCGIVVPEVEVRIDDPDPDTGIGEIVATGQNIMQGYYKNEQATKGSFTEDGWLITGDKGKFDTDGYLFIKGRSKNLIVGASGENIYPEEIEFHLSHNAFVLESLVFEKEAKIYARVHLDYDAVDQQYGTSSMDESDASKIIQDILEHLRKETNAKIASYSRVHKIIEQPEEFEKTPTKKIKRFLYTT